jgi:mannan endo-1,4-beta-mannosidase
MWKCRSNIITLIKFFQKLDHKLNECFNMNRVRLQNTDLSRSFGLKKVFLFFCLIILGVSASRSQGFTISGTQLIDANGNNFIMKGLAVPLSWFVTNVNDNIGNIRKNTGANCLRIVVNVSTPDSCWQTCVQKCIYNKMIPMVELHDATCGTTAKGILDMANFWAGKSAFLTQPYIARYILINIANEWGDWAMANSNQTAWKDAYQPAIAAIRNAGINTTLVIDADGCGQDIRNGETLRNYGNALQKFDPKHNLLFSVHMYCEWAIGSSSNVSAGLPAIQKAGIPIIVGEFGYQHDNNRGGICDIPESDIISTCQSNGIGWLAWSLKGNGNPVPYLDLSKDWAGNDLSDWGNTVINGPNGTKTASTASVFDK